MSIDEAIKHYEDMKKGWYLIDPDELLDFTIEVMQKYSKIEQILKDIPYGGEATVRRIQEVVEDGKID